ncbi:hypothetical protein [Streptomyces sp. NPDC093544]|uniref:hypothetical protein n=1 Tax=Streptomyces sp. NPDC093544 TaxID=3155200 RepID=UPI0034336BE9
MTTTKAPRGSAARRGITTNGLRLIRRHAPAFVRFAGLGSGVTLAASAALVLFSQWIPWMAANALTTVASTVAATEMHARVSFGHGRPGLAGHLKSAATIVAGWLATSAAVGLLAVLRPGTGLVLQQTVYLSATALVGIGRYLVLRLAVFAERAPQSRTGGGIRVRPAYDEGARPVRRISDTGTRGIISLNPRLSTPRLAAKPTAWAAISVSTAATADKSRGVAAVQVPLAQRCREAAKVVGQCPRHGSPPAATASEATQFEDTGRNAAITRAA